MGVDAGRAQAGFAPRRRGNLVQQVGTEANLGAPAGRLLDTAVLLQLHRALVGLAA